MNHELATAKQNDSDVSTRLTDPHASGKSATTYRVNSIAVAARGPGAKTPSSQARQEENINYSLNMFFSQSEIILNKFKMIENSYFQHLPTCTLELFQVISDFEENKCWKSLCVRSDIIRLLGTMFILLAAVLFTEMYIKLILSSKYSSVFRDLMHSLNQ